MSLGHFNKSQIFENCLTKFFKANVFSSKYTGKIKLLGFMVKIPNSKMKNSDYSLFFVSLDLKHSIKCLINTDETMELNKVYYVEIDDCMFDYIVTEHNKNTLINNLILVVNHIESLNEKKEISSVLQKKFPQNINNNLSFKQNLNQQLNRILQKVINEYYLTTEDVGLSATNFLNKKFDIQNNTVSLFEIIQKVYRINQKGLLILTKQSEEYPYRYFSDLYNYENEIGFYEWKKILLFSPTMIDKRKEIGDPLEPSFVNIREFTEKKMVKEKDLFLLRKTKRNEALDLEKEYVDSQQVKGLINFYGDVSRNIGNSLVEKYTLFKKYSELIKE